MLERNVAYEQRDWPAETRGVSRGAALGGLGALDDARNSSVVYDSGADEDADFADDDAAVDAVDALSGDGAGRGRGRSAA